jgi:hypothetical protein
MNEVGVAIVCAKKFRKISLIKKNFFRIFSESWMTIGLKTTLLGLSVT